MVEYTRRELFKMASGALLGTSAGAVTEATTPSHKPEHDKSWVERSHIVGTAVGAAVGAKLAHHLSTYDLYKKKEPDDAHANEPPKATEEISQTSEVTRPEHELRIITDAAAEHYRKLYDTIKAAYNRAITSKKHLVILMGEIHGDSSSLLNEMMITDIASRLGIKDGVTELGRDVPKFTPYDDVRKRRLATLHTLLEESLASSKLKLPEPEAALIHNYHSLPEKEQREMDATVMTAALTPNLNTVEKMPYSKPRIKVAFWHDIIMHHPNLLGINQVDGDPNCGACPEAKSRFIPEIEDGMIASVKAVPRSCIALYGLLHLPPIHDALKKESDIELLTIDVGNRELPPPSHRKDQVERDKWLKALDAEIEKPVLDVPYMNIPEVILAATQASIINRVRDGEISEERGAMLNHIVTGVTTLTHPLIIDASEATAQRWCPDKPDIRVKGLDDSVRKPHNR